MHSFEDLWGYTRTFHQVSASLIANTCLSEHKCNLFVLSSFPDSLKECLQHCLQIVNSDIHPEDPYPMADVTEMAKFLLTGSVFCLLLPSIEQLSSPNLPTHSSTFLLSSSEDTVVNHYSHSTDTPITIEEQAPMLTTNPTTSYQEELDRYDVLDTTPDGFTWDSDPDDFDSTLNCTYPEFQSYLVEAWFHY